ncbi:chemotaxis protein [Vibrio aestuarianus]|uniref:chemotaxis protein n=1 Tax=Vibrio aestuarianus TaxID=28171 RepID=UPI00237CA808|nr:chemotaxis protein [Vibrio aestuarianus]MDE1253186.1 chemotaxis protein [Vibrio aestuarianus]
MFFYRVFISLIIVMGLSACSLLEVKLDGPTPLTKQELNTRILTREYAQQFFSLVEQSADDIAATYDSNDQVNQSYVLLWKINAEEGMQRSAYQVSPMAALIDSWVFTYQMEQFFQSQAGDSLFKTEHAQNVAIQLKSSIDELAKSLLKGDAYRQSQVFVTQFSQAHPFTDLTFPRTPAYRAWLVANNIDADEVVTTLGSMPEALGDISDRVSLASDQTFKLMSWKAKLLALNSNASVEELTITLDSLRKSSDAFQNFIENNPDYMRNLAEQMAIELQPLVNDIDTKTDEKLAQLSVQRQALDDMVARERIELINMVERERKALAVIVSDEREKFAQDLEVISQDILTLAMDKLIELIKSTIVYFVLFIIAIFFAPLGLGYHFGKRSARGKASQ